MLYITLTPYMQATEYSMQTWSISCLLMPWLLVLPGHQEAWYRLYKTGKSLSSSWVDFNSMAPGKFEWNFGYVIFKWILLIDGWGISCETALVWISLDFTDDPSTLVQVMAWCRQATSQYMSQCWPRSLSPYGVTRPEWVNHLHNSNIEVWYQMHIYVPSKQFSM